MEGLALAEVPAAWEEGCCSSGLGGVDPPVVTFTAVNQHVIAAVADDPAGMGADRLAELRADALAGRLPAQVWKKISAGAGAKAPRIYHWAGPRSGQWNRWAATGCWSGAA